VQQPSSLIFLAIVVIWGGYLLQHWIRRREALATARSVDQFTDAMRVLERRERPDGIVEQTDDSANANRPSAPRSSESAPRPSLRAGTVMTGETPQPQRDSAYEKDDAVPAPIASKVDDDTLQRFGRYAATAGSPKLRTTALVGTVSLLLITIVCAPFGALPWWSPVLMLLASGGAFVWCRASAMAAKAVKRPQDVRGPNATPRASTAKAGSRVGAQLPKRKATASVVPQAPVAARPAAVAQTAVAQVAAVAERPAERVFDVTASVAAPAPRAAEIVYDASVYDGRVETAYGHGSSDGWQPVAVPPPTYTMKERAPERPQQAPAPAAKRTSYEGVANEDLPFDGLALDQDLEELPSVFRVS
jgi:hypothetical protein